jgi:hypothetical protein
MTKAQRADALLWAAKISLEESMTDRYYALTVALEHDVRADDAQRIIEAIKRIRGVLSVEGNVSDTTNWVAEERVRRELGEKLFAVITGGTK